MARVAKPAPDFEANAVVAGEFKNLKLSDYRGVVLQEKEVLSDRHLH
jgi:hypothetical protein